MAGGFRVQTQRHALRMTRNNNEHQRKNKGRMATVGAALVAALPCLTAGAHKGRPYNREAIRARRAHQTKARRGFPPGRNSSVSISRII
jgi:hypothetical protein